MQAPPGQALEALVNVYLSPEHCAHPADRCPIAALATEVARHPGSVRATIDHAVRALAAARAPSDDALRRTILEGARAFYVGALCRRP